MDPEMKKELDDVNASLVEVKALLVEIFNYMRTVI